MKSYLTFRIEFRNDIFNLTAGPWPEIETLISFNTLWTNWMLKAIRLPCIMLWRGYQLCTTKLIVLRSRLIIRTVCSPNKGTQIRECFPYLSQNWEIYQVRERQNFPYFKEKLVKIRRFCSKTVNFPIFLGHMLKFFDQN